jgi:spore germination protein KC
MKNLEHLQNQQEEVVKEEILTVIEFAKEHEMDFFSLGTKFFQKYPKVWENYEKNWGERVPTINFDIQVNSNINRSYLLNEPVSREGEKQ